MVRARLQISEDELQEVVAERRRAIDEAIRGGIGIAHEAVRMAFPVALDAALDLGDLEETNRVVESLAARPRGEVPPFLRAQVRRARAMVTGLPRLRQSKGSWPHRHSSSPTCSHRATKPQDGPTDGRAHARVPRSLASRSGPIFRAKLKCGGNQVDEWCTAPVALRGKLGAVHRHDCHAVSCASGGWSVTRS